MPVFPPQGPPRRIGRYAGQRSAPKTVPIRVRPVDRQARIGCGKHPKPILAEVTDQELVVGAKRYDLYQGTLQAHLHCQACIRAHPYEPGSWTIDLVKLRKEVKSSRRKSPERVAFFTLEQVGVYQSLVPLTPRQAAAMGLVGDQPAHPPLSGQALMK